MNPFMNTKRWLSALLVLLLLAGCAVRPEFGGDRTPGQDTVPDEPARFSVDDLNPELAGARLAFALDLFQEVRKAEASDTEDSGAVNLFLSPVSIATALFMTSAGAAGDTLDAFRKTLHADGVEMEAIHREQQVLIDLLTHGEKEVLFTLANSLWADEGLDFHEAFLEQSKQYYGAEITDLDLQGPEAPEKINGWAKEHTGGKIPQIIDGPFGDQTILMLLNAVYFNGNWANPFEPDATRPETFTRADGSTLEVPMMHNKGRFDYLDGDGFQAVRLPYKGYRFNMLVFLPDEHNGLGAFLDTLNAENWQNWLDGFQDATGELAFPKFQMEYQANLKNVLHRLGLGVAFDPHEADFSNMISLPENVFLQNVVHKSYIDVQEKGTVAAAVTGAYAGATSAPSKTFRMEVDRPFFFVIHDRKTSSLLFMGIVENPGA